LGHKSIVPHINYLTKIKMKGNNNPPEKESIASKGIASKGIASKGIASEGDLIRIKNKKFDLTGFLIPQPYYENIVSIKLQNGYNIGIELDDSTEIKVLKKRVKSKRARKIPEENHSKETIALLGTGGTIACWVDYRTGAVHPAQKIEELAFSTPEIFEIANIKGKVVFQLLSEDMAPSNWKRLAHEVADALNNGARGVVIPHGTDTMSYTAAALSFMLEGLSGPVVLVGSQRSSDRPSSDSYQNLLAAVRVSAKSSLNRVVIVMHEGSSDKRVSILLGTRSRKMHTSKRGAFKSINSLPIGWVEGSKIMLRDDYYKPDDYHKLFPKTDSSTTPQKVKIDDRLDEKVRLIYVHPGCDIQWINPENTHGLVLMGTGLGHTSESLLEKIRILCDQKIPVVMSSQCIYGRTNLNVYSRGRELLKLGVIPAEDILPEVALVKLMCVLGRTKDREEVKNLMTKNIAGEISSTIPLDNTS
jgi:glutamyl-tRNA(Gln) amidotransferase subunit D